MSTSVVGLDIFSFSFSLAGYPPFTEERKDMALPKQIINGSYTFPDQYWKGISEDAIDLIKQLMTVDPEKRITMDQAVNHAWLNVGI